MKRWAKRQEKRDGAVLEGAETTEAEVKAANEVAHIYLTTLKAKLPWAKLVPAGKKVSETRWWVHFVKAARLIAELNAEPKQYLQAQFDRLAWKKGAYPFPTQLCSDSAIAAYVERRSRYEEKTYRKVHAEAALMYDPLIRERRKLETWAKRLRVSGKRVLRDHPEEFTEAFHRELGTWAAVREVYAA
jgi:hypothetical protein